MHPGLIICVVVFILAILGMILIRKYEKKKEAKGKARKEQEKKIRFINNSFSLLSSARKLSELLIDCPYIDLEPEQIKFEAISYLYFICDTIAFAAKKDRYSFKEMVSVSPSYFTKQIDYHKFDQRQQLYTDALYDKVFIRGYIASGVQPESNDIVTKSILLFTDFLLHPACADNYIEAPILPLDMDFTFEFFIDIYLRILNITKELGMKIKGN